MCLRVSKPRNKDRKIVYKRFDVFYGDIFSPYQRTPYKLGKEKRAEGVCKRTKYERYSWVEAGIYCYSNLKTAKERIRCGEVIVRCSVKPEDWLADGEYNECLYKKITPIKNVYQE